jgi:PAS domain S-box-containing protein
VSVSLEFLQRVLDSLTVALIVTDRDNKIVLFNRTAGEILTQDPGSRLGSSALDCHPKHSEAAVQRMVDDLRDRVYEPYHGWVNFQDHDLYEYISALRDEQGEWLGTLVEIHDVTDKVELLRRLGEWNEPKVSGVGDDAPRAPHPIPDAEA